MGVVYLIQPAELKGTDRYKVGCSHNDGVSRITTGYNLTTVTFLVVNVDDPFEVERRLVHEFTQRFHQLPGSREYFAGNILHMMACFRAITSDTLDAKLALLEAPPLQKNQCPKCRKVFSRKDYMKIHLKSCDGFQKNQCKICRLTFLSRKAKWYHVHHVTCKPPTQFDGENFLKPMSL